MKEQMNSTMVSICMCTYNGESFLPKQLSSIINQDYTDYELIIIDDCSTDSTWSILQNFKKSNANVTIFKNKKNLGFNKNFELAISKAKGKYITICDQDNIWASNRLSLLIDSINNKSLVYADSEFIDENDDSLGKYFFDNRKYLNDKHPLAFIFDNCLPGHTALFKKSLLSDLLPIPTGIYYDWWLAFVASCQDGLCKIDQTLVYYRQHDQTVTDPLAFKHKKLTAEEKVKKINQKTSNMIEHCKILKKYNFKDTKTSSVLDKIIIGYEKKSKNNFYSFSLLWVLLINRNELFKLRSFGFLKRITYSIRESFSDNLKIFEYKIKSALGQ